MQYVAFSFDFSLKQIAIGLHDDKTELLSLAVHKAAVKFEGRPSAGGIKSVLLLHASNMVVCGLTFGYCFALSPSFKSLDGLSCDVLIELKLPLTA